MVLCHIMHHNSSHVKKINKKEKQILARVNAVSVLKHLAKKLEQCLLCEHSLKSMTLYTVTQQNTVLDHLIPRYVVYAPWLQ